MNKEEIYNLLVEQGFLTDAKKLYGMNIEPRGKEIYLALKGIKGAEWDAAYTQYTRYVSSKQWQDDWKAFKLAHNLKVMVP